MNPVAIHESSILAIEDDPVLGAYVHEELQRGGFQVTWCRTAWKGWRPGARLFDLVLMDILLPGLDGLDACAPASAQRHAGHPDVGAGAEADRISGFERGADDYLPKPFSMAELRVRIEAILRRVAWSVAPGAAGGASASCSSTSHCATSALKPPGGPDPSEFRLLDILNRSQTKC
jgi:two-component system response regulator PfeR